MSVLRWQESYSIGIPVLDADHKILFNLINQLFDAREEGQTREVVGSIFNVLVEYGVGHVRREEHLMQACGYPRSAEHRQAHLDLARQVEKFRQAYEGGRHAAVDEMLALVKNWLVDHIVGEDTQIGAWVDGLSPRPEVLLEIVRIPLGEGD